MNELAYYRFSVIFDMTKKKFFLSKIILFFNVSY